MNELLNELYYSNILSEYTLLYDNWKQFYVLFNDDMRLIKHIRKLYNKVDL